MQLEAAGYITLLMCIENCLSRQMDPLCREALCAIVPFAIMLSVGCACPR